MVYYIYHPKNGSINHECKPALYMYEMVYKLEANSFEEAFKMSQNDFNEDYASLKQRSTCVGDIIMSKEDYDNNRCHLVKGNGFQDVPSTWLSYIDWSATSNYDDEERYDSSFYIMPISPIFKKALLILSGSYTATPVLYEYSKVELNSLTSNDSCVVSYEVYDEAQELIKMLKIRSTSQVDSSVLNDEK